jgi:hypothetical protein
MGYYKYDASASRARKVVGLLLALIRTEHTGRSVVAHWAKKMFLKKPACLFDCLLACLHFCTFVRLYLASFQNLEDGGTEA